MKVHIVSDGTPSGTRVFDADGKFLPGVTKVQIDIDARNCPQAQIAIASSFDLEGDGAFFVSDPWDNGRLKRVKRVEFEDGTGCEF